MEINKETSQEIAEKLIKPILDIIDDYFFIIFGNYDNEKADMIPIDENLEKMKQIAERMEDRASSIGASSIILTACGKDGIREEQKANDMADIAKSIYQLALTRFNQVKNAHEYANNEQGKKRFLASLGFKE